MRSWICGLALGMIFVFGATNHADASGFVFHQTNARANGMGMAYGAVADDPSAVFFNPAGLGFLKGIQATTGVTFINGREKYSARSGNDADARTQYIPLPHFFSSMSINEQFVIGGGLHVPYGLELDWPDQAETRYNSQFAYLRNQFLSFGGAFRPLDWLSISAIGHYVTTRRLAPGFPKYGLRVHRAVDTSEAIFESLRHNPAFASTPDSALRSQARAISQTAQEPQSRLKGNGDGFGYTLGILVKPIKEFNLGFTYRSEVNVRGSGTINFTGVQDPAGLPPGTFTNLLTRSNIRTNIVLPPSFSIALSSQIGEKLLLSASADWTGWSTLRDIRIRIVTGRPRPVEILDLRWTDSWAIRLGAEYLVIGNYSELQKNYLKGKIDAESAEDAEIAADEGEDVEESTAGGWALALRAGYIWDESPVPNSTVSAFLPDNDRHAFTLGVGVDMGWIRLDTAFQYFDLKTVRRDNASEGVDNEFRPSQGKFQADAFIYSFGVTLRF